MVSDDRGHVTERIRNRRTNEREEKQEFFNMDEGKIRNREIVGAVRQAPNQLIQACIPFLYPLRTSENPMFFRGFRKGTLVRNWLTHFSPMFHIYTPENVRKPFLVFWRFQGV